MAALVISPHAHARLHAVAPGPLPGRSGQHCVAGPHGSCARGRDAHARPSALFLPTKAAGAVCGPRQARHDGRRVRGIRAQQKEEGGVGVGAKPNVASGIPKEDLLALIRTGPLVTKVGLSAEEVEAQLGQWTALGTELALQLCFDPASISQSQLRRIFQYYLPVFFWCKQELVAHRAHWAQSGSLDPPPPLLIGISAPQGCGKTTVVESLEHLLAYTGLKAASVSLDDFYLTAAHQSKLAADNPENRLLELRGNAGSHDMALATSTIRALKAATLPDSSVPLPRYDKSAFQGRGDRAQLAAWPVAQGPLDCVLLEGWMLGFNALPEADAAAVDPQLVAVNRSLQEYEALHREVDSWIVIQVEDVDCVFKWRLEAEVRMRESGRGGMTDEQVADFVSRYMPAYKAYLQDLYDNGPTNTSPSHCLSFYVDKNRNPLP